MTPLALLVALAPFLPPVTAQSKEAAPRAPIAAVTRHTGTFNGVTVEYTATVAETLIADAAGQPAAMMVTTAYVRDGVSDREHRPVMFAFNGGPGASCSPLHMSALGPRRRDGTRIIDNPYSPLDTVDLVFIDPIETGFSRLLPGVDGKPFWSISGDAASVKSFILSWLATHGRESSPRFLVGESYGTVRAGQIVFTGHAEHDLEFDGVLLLSLVARSDGAELRYVALVPVFAVAAAYHHKGDSAGKPVEQVFEEAARFALTDYMGALLQGDALPESEKERIAAELSRRIGLPAAFILDKSLRLEEYDFMLKVLEDRGLRVGQLDSRATGELAFCAARHPPYDDPSFSLSVLPSASSSTSGSTSPAPHPLQTYLVEELKFPTSETYTPLNLKINSEWFYDADPEQGGAAEQIGSVMRAQPNLRLFWAAGYYDITTPLFAGRYALDHAGIPPERLTMAAFATGHSVFEGDENLARFTQAVRAFVTAGAKK